jgi:hypothetical protein
MSMSMWLTDWLLDASASDPALPTALRAAVAGSDRAQVLGEEFTHAGPVQRGAFGAQLGGDLTG